MSEQPTVNIWELSDLCTPWCIHVAATLGIADQIQAGVDTVGALAAAAGCDAGVLHCLLAHLAGKGVFVEISPGRFALNDAARQLLDPILRLSLNLDSIGGRMAHAWGTLLQFTRTGVPAYDQVFDLPFWQDLDAHPQISADFDTLIGPAGHGAPNPNFQISAGWQAVQTLVDVGGGTGAMLAGILRLHPHLRGVLVDQPATVDRSAAIFQAAGVSARAVPVGQSFFDPLPPGADLYLLRGIINDWPDAEALTILRRCADAARPSGRVVILKSVGPDDAPRDLVIEMLLLGGKHRTLTEFKELARQAGLQVSSAGQQPDSYFVVECRPLEGG